MVLSLALILGACHVFTNAIEWFGKRLNLGHAVVGSVLAAVGTALPETIIPIIAIIHAAVVRYHGQSGGEYVDVGIGAVVGAPFMLATLAFFVTAAAVVVYRLLKRRELRLTADPAVFTHDVLFFVIVYGVAISASLLHMVLSGPPLTLAKTALGIALVGAYVVYIRRTFSKDAGHVEAELEELMASRFFRLPPMMLLIVMQLLLAIGAIVLGAHLFVEALTHVAEVAGISPLILSLIVTPIATELPEKFNSIVWIGRRKDTLALGNITGAMVFQSCIPVAFAIVFTHWNLHGSVLLSAVLAMLSGVVNLVYVRIKGRLSPWLLLTSGLLYALFVLYVTCGQNATWMAWLNE
jgi:cation:H+ antiporter